MLNKAWLYICILCVLSICGTQGVEVGFSVSDGTESVGLYTSYTASDFVSVNEEATGSFYHPGISDRRQASGKGDLLATQAVSGSGGHSIINDVYAIQASMLAVTSSITTTPATLSLAQEALVRDADAAGFDIAATKDNELVEQVSSVLGGPLLRGSLASTQNLQLGWYIRSEQDTFIEGSSGCSTALAQDGWTNVASTELGMTDGRLMTEMVAVEETRPFDPDQDPAAVQDDRTFASQRSTASGSHIWANTLARDQLGNSVETDLDGAKGWFRTNQEAEVAAGADLYQRSEMVVDKGSTGSTSIGVGGYDAHIKTDMTSGCMTTEQWAYADASALVLERSGLVGVEKGSSESSTCDAEGNNIDALTQAEMDGGNFWINQRVWSDPTGSGSMRWIEAERALTGLSKITAVDSDSDSVEAQVTGTMDRGLFSTSQEGTAAAGKATTELQASASESLEGEATIASRDADGNSVESKFSAEMDHGLFSNSVAGEADGSASAAHQGQADSATTGSTSISVIDSDGDSVDADISAEMDEGLFSASQEGAASAGKATTELQASASESLEGEATIASRDADGNSVESKFSAEMDHGLFSNSVAGEADGSAAAAHQGQADSATNGTSSMSVVASDGDSVDADASAKMDDGLFTTYQEGDASAGKATAGLQANGTESLEGESGIVARDADGNEAGTEFASIMDRGLFSNVMAGEADGSAEVGHRALAERATSSKASSYARYAGGLAETNLTADQSLGEFSMTMGGLSEDDASDHEAVAYMVDLIASGDEIEADSKGQVAGEDSDIQTDLFKNTPSDANVSGEIWAVADDDGTESHQVIEARGRIESQVRSNRGLVRPADLSYNSVGVDTHLLAQTDAAGPYSDRWTIFYLDKAVGTETIQSSVDEAYDHPSNFDTIDIAAGVYHENVVDADKSLHFIGDGSDRTIVDGDASGRVFTIGTIRDDIFVDMFGMGIRNGYVRGADETGAAGENGTGGEAVGGGIWNGADLTLIEVNVTGNGVRGGDGRGGDIAGASGETVTGGDGFGGRALGGGIYSQGCLTLVETVVSDNHAVGGDGFGGEARGGDGVDGDDSHLVPVNGDGSGGGFEYKKAGDGSFGVAGSAGSAGSDGYGGSGTGGQGLGGGIYSSNGALRITDSLISENSAEGGDGIGGQGIGGSGGDGGDGSRGGNGGDGSVWGIFFGMGVGGAGGNGGAGAAGVAGGDGIGGEGKGGLACGGGILSDGTLLEIDDSEVLDNVAKGGDATGGRGQGGIGGAGGVGNDGGDGGEGMASPAVGLLVSVAVGQGGDGGDGGAGGSGGAGGNGTGGEAVGGNAMGGGISSLDDSFHLEDTTVSGNDATGGEAQGGDGNGGKGGDGGNSGDAGDGGKGTALSLGFGIGFDICNILLPGIGLSASVGLGGDGGTGGAGGAGGAGGDGVGGDGSGGSAYGGGIYAQDETEILGSFVADNVAASGVGIGGQAFGATGGMGAAGKAGGSSDASSTSVGAALGLGNFSIGGGLGFAMANPGDGGAGATGGKGGEATGGSAFGGESLGGGIFGSGDMVVASSEIEQNRAIGGDGIGGRAEGGRGGDGGDGNDGGEGATDGFGVGVGVGANTNCYGVGMGGSGSNGGDGGAGATGGAGGMGAGGSGIGGGAIGGGLYSAQSLISEGSTIQNNQALGGSGIGGNAFGGLGGDGGDGGDGGSISRSEGGGGGVGIGLRGSFTGAIADLLECFGLYFEKPPNTDGAIGAGVGVAIGGSAAGGFKGGQGGEAFGGAGTGGQVAGGGIYAAGSALSLSESEILRNEAIGGAGVGGEALGGAGGDGGAGGFGGDATGRGGGGAGFMLYTSGAGIYADWPDWIPGLPEESWMGINPKFEISEKYSVGMGLGLGLGGDGGDGSTGGEGGSSEGGQGTGGSAYGGGIYSQAGSTLVENGNICGNLADGGRGVGGSSYGGEGGMGGAGGNGGTVLGASDSAGVSYSFNIPDSINHVDVSFGIESFISSIIGIPIPEGTSDFDVTVGFKLPAITVAAAGGNSIGLGVGIAGKGSEGDLGGTGGSALGGEGRGGDGTGGGFYSAGSSTLSETSLLQNRAIGGDGIGGEGQGGAGGQGGHGGEGGSADSRGMTIGGNLIKSSVNNLYYSVDFNVGGGLSFAHDGGDGGAGGQGGAGSGGNGVAGLGAGGGIYNGGNMVLTDSLVQESWAVGGRADGGSGMGGVGGIGGSGGLGGAGKGQGMGAGLNFSIGPNLGKAEATLRLAATSSTGGFAGNGGDGGEGGIGGDGTNGISLGGDSLGGGIFDAGTLIQDNSDVSGNDIQAGGASAEAVQGGSGGLGGGGGMSGGESSSGPNISLLLFTASKLGPFQVLSGYIVNEAIDLTGSLIGQDGDPGNAGGNGGRTDNAPTPGTAQGEDIYS